jgi:encore-like protein
MFWNHYYDHKFTKIIIILHRNYKDRMTLLRIEQDMIALVRDTKRTCHRFPAMSSYHRMLVHQVAAYFGMEHNVDQSGTVPKKQF